MLQLLCVILLGLTALRASAQLDTTHLKTLVSTISTEKDHIEFWKFIEHRDQDLMKTPDWELLNREDLVLVSYYLNRFGFPDIEVMGKESSIILTVWVHIKSYEVSKIAFPIILKAYEFGAITRETLLKQFLHAIYHRLYDDNEYLNKPWGEMFNDLGVAISDKIDVALLVTKLQEFDDLLNLPKDTIGLWKTPEVIDTHLLNGKPIVTRFPGQKMMIYKVKDGRIFFTTVYRNPPDPTELVILNQSPRTFREKNKTTERYYQITNENSMRYVLENGKVKYEAFVVKGN